MRPNHITRPCDHCGIDYRAYPTLLSKGFGQFCSRPCSHKGRLKSWSKPLPEVFTKFTPLRPETGCWEWSGSKMAGGYGKTTHQGKDKKGTWIAWELASGDAVRKGQIVGHTCDNPPCVRNDDAGTYEVEGKIFPRYGHLWLGTNLDNRRDMVAKGRGPSGDRNGSRTHPERMPRGESVWIAKLTEANVVEIRQRYAAGGISQTDLAKEYGISFQLVHSVVRNKIWKHVQATPTPHWDQHGLWGKEQ